MFIIFQHSSLLKYGRYYNSVKFYCCGPWAEKVLHPSIASNHHVFHKKLLSLSLLEASPWKGSLRLISLTNLYLDTLSHYGSNFFEKFRQKRKLFRECVKLMKALNRFFSFRNWSSKTFWDNQLLWVLIDTDLKNLTTSQLDISVWSCTEIQRLDEHIFWYNDLYSMVGMQTEEQVPRGFTMEI